jgi:mycofactocin system glycosyltransferase
MAVSAILILMNETWDTLASSRFWPVPGLRVLIRNDTWLAIVPQPLRVLRLTAPAGIILARCDGTHTVKDIAMQLSSVSVAMVAATCAHLSWRGLLVGDMPALPAPPPTVAIIIPTRNRASQLRACLESLRQLTYPRERLEIIIVDDASTDDTTATLRAATTGLPLTMLRNERQLGGALCRNRAAGATHADILAFTDSDCLVSPTWLSDLVPYLCLPGVHAVGGIVQAADSTTAIGRYEDRFSSLRRGPALEELTLDGPTNYLATANLLIRRATFAALDGFADLRYGEDVDLCWRLLATNKRALAVPGGTVAHSYRTTPLGFAATRIAYASSEAILTRRHPTQRRRLALPSEPAAFAMLVLAAIGMLWHALAALLLFWKRQEANDSGHKGSAKGAAWASPDLISPARPLLPILSAPLLVAGIASLRHIQETRRQGIPLGTGTVALATLRGHLAYLYHFCQHLSRYYMWPLILATLLWPPLLPVTLAIVLIPALTDYCRRRPRLSPWHFIAIRLLDHAAYGPGVVLGAWRHRYWRALIPRITRS